MFINIIHTEDEEQEGFGGASCVGLGGRDVVGAGEGLIVGLGAGLGVEIGVGAGAGILNPPGSINSHSN